MYPQPVPFVLSFDGDMSATRTSTSVKLVGRHASIRFAWPATGYPVGTFGLRVSDDDATWTTVPAALLPGATQPDGSGAGSWRIDGLETDAAYLSATYTPTSGGVGATPEAAGTVKA